ncbi:MAG: BACON domain-containing protein [Sodaliphilus sp.]
MKKYVLLILCLAIAFIPLTAQAQKAADKLFQQGQQLQMKQTERAQKQAIAIFIKAKKAYDSKDKKAMCDNQIQICYKNIKTIQDRVKPYNYDHRRKSDTDVHSANVTKKDALEEKTPEPTPKKEPVELSLSKSTLEFKANGSKDDNHEIEVKCNYTTWTYTCPDWVSITKNGNILTLTASPNKTGKERSGKVVVDCEGTIAELLVYQARKKKLGLF